MTLRQLSRQKWKFSTVKQWLKPQAGLSTQPAAPYARVLIMGHNPDQLVRILTDYLLSGVCPIMCRQLVMAITLPDSPNF
jgi:uncharacterized protein (DUF2062 family)